MSEFDGELEFTEKMTNEYDAEGNCSIYSYYHYIPSNGAWLFSFSFEYEYVAFFLFFLRNTIYLNDPPKMVHRSTLSLLFV